MPSPIGISQQLSALNSINRHLSTEKGCGFSLTGADNVGTVRDVRETALKVPMAFKDWLRRQIEGRMMDQKEFAAAAGVAFGTLRVWLTEPHPNIRGKNLAKLAHALGISREEIEERLSADAGLEAEASGLETGSFQRFAEIPTFDLTLAAGPWSDVIDIPDVCGPDSIAQGLFRVRLSGDSMAPTYKDGMIVEFECLRDGMDELRPGRDYYVQREDGAATFKRLEKADDETLYLRALNRRKYPSLLSVLRCNVVRMAIAKGEYRPFES